nr:diagnostic antigen gp50 [Hymenolepis microstoma]
MCYSALRMLLIRLILVIIYTCCGYAGSQEAYGSRIVNTSRGPLQPLKFAMSKPPEGEVYYKTGKSNSLSIDSSGNCLINGMAIGKPCNFDEESQTATLSFSDVSEWQYIEVTDGYYVYTVYFIDDCKFPTPKPGDVLLPPLIPLCRNLKSENSVDLEFKIYDPPKDEKYSPNVTFCLNKYHFDGKMNSDKAECLMKKDFIAGFGLLQITLYENSLVICVWQNGVSTDEKLCPHLTTDSTTHISDVTIKIKKGESSFVTYKWGTEDSSVAYVDVVQHNVCTSTFEDHGSTVAFQLDMYQGDEGLGNSNGDVATATV